MDDNRTDQFSASEQGLGYLYQPRLALLYSLQLPEDTSIFVEKDDDLDFVDKDGKKTLASLKHKAVGEHLTNLSADFWKSVRIWLTRYVEDGRVESTHRFYLFTTNEVPATSFLKAFLPNARVPPADQESLTYRANAVLEKTTSELIQTSATQFHALTEEEQDNFLG